MRAHLAQILCLEPDLLLLDVTSCSGGYDYYLEQSGLLDDEKGAVTA
ncbi:MAG: hypothetical protein OSB65_17480 [Roseibacillus sp.]|nr:hypothetical protein [Roseibacillus sp.]